MRAPVLAERSLSWLSRDTLKHPEAGTPFISTLMAVCHATHRDSNVLNRPRLGRLNAGISRIRYAVPHSPSFGPTHAQNRSNACSIGSEAPL